MQGDFRTAWHTRECPEPYLRFHYMAPQLYFTPMLLGHLPCGLAHQTSRGSTSLQKEAVKKIRFHAFFLNAWLEDSPFYVHPLQTAWAEIHSTTRYTCFVSGKHSSSELDLNSADATEEQSLFTILNTLCSSFTAAEINTIKIHTGLPVLVLPGFVDVDVWSV